MDCNANSIRALEEQIREHEKAIVQLKRARNSLLNISKFPPEVLGNIFHWNVAPKHYFAGLDRGSYNFLLVCHHWFEVASRTPELWSYWGNTPWDWARWCRRSRTSPLDLILGDNDCEEIYFDTTVRNALRYRATCDTIRRVHLAAGGPRFQSSVIASLTSNSEGLRSNSMVSFILRNESDTPVDLSDFFANYRFPKLQRLDLVNCKISPWDHVISQTSALTTLELEFSDRSLRPTTSQLLSILASNPALQKVALRGCGDPDDDGGTSSRVQLRHLKGLRLDGDLPDIVGLLRQLDLSRNMEKLYFDFSGCDTTDISQVIGPYLRDHLQHRDGPQNRLKVCASSSYYTSRPCPITLHVGDLKGTDFPIPAWGPLDTFAAITVALNGIPSRNALERVTLDLITHIPREEVVYFQTCNYSIATEDAYTQFPNLRAMSFDSTPLSAAFPSTLVEDGKILPSLEYVLLKEVLVGGGDWSPLIAFLAYRVSSGNRLDTLVIACSHVCREVVKDIKDMVRELIFDRQNIVCPFGTC